MNKELFDELLIAIKSCASVESKLFYQTSLNESEQQIYDAVKTFLNTIEKIEN